MQDDAALLRRYAADHADDAFAELVRRHLNFVYSAALRQRGHLTAGTVGINPSPSRVSTQGARFHVREDEPQSTQSSLRLFFSVFSVASVVHPTTRFSNLL